MSLVLNFCLQTEPDKRQSIIVLRYIENMCFNFTGNQDDMNRYALISSLCRINENILKISILRMNLVKDSSNNFSISVALIANSIIFYWMIFKSLKRAVMNEVCCYGLYTCFLNGQDSTKDEKVFSTPVS